jgi:uncharacterized protein YndB with AHSA1/START domain
MALSGDQQFTTEINASVGQCFATITTFENYPEWFSTIEATAVLERYRDGLGKRVEYLVDMRLKTIRYVLEYEYDKPLRLTWRSVEGDIDAIEGAYVFEKLGPQRSSATCRQAVSFGFWVPGPLRAILERHALTQAVLEFKAAAEAAAKEAPGRRRQRTRS